MTVPTVDLSNDDADVAPVVDDALRRVGFFTIVGHGVPAATVDAAWDAAARFFDLPIEEKLRWRSDDPGYPYGYEPLAGEALAAAHGEAGARPDLKETFNLAPPSRRRVWPGGVSGFEASWSAYYAAMAALAGRLMTVCAVALGLEPGFFDDKIDEHLSALRALNYPPQSTAPVAGQLRAGSHTDYGTLTILKPGPASRGLQVETVDGEWIDVPIRRDGFVVNIGDLMAMWTNDRWRSTPHRVVNPEQRVAATERRQSMAFFHQPNGDAEIVCLPSCTSAANPARYPPTTSGVWLAARVAAAHSRD